MLILRFLTGSEIEVLLSDHWAGSNFNKNLPSASTGRIRDHIHSATFNSIRDRSILDQLSHDER